MSNDDDINKSAEKFNKDQEKLLADLSKGLKPPALKMFKEKTFNIQLTNTKNAQIKQGERQQEQGLSALNSNAEGLLVLAAQSDDPAIKAIYGLQAQELFAESDWVPIEKREGQWEDWQVKLGALENQKEYDTVSNYIEEAIRNPSEADINLDAAEEALEEATTIKPKERIVLQRSINTAKDAAQTARDKLEKEVQEAEASDFVERINDEDPETVLTVQNVLDSTLDFKTKEHFLGELEKKNKGLLVGEGNPIVQFELLRRVNDTEADDHINSVQQLIPFLGKGGLSGSYFPTLRDRVEAMQVPANKIKEKMFAVYMKSALALLVTPSNVPNSDPAGLADYSRFYNHARGLFDDGIKEGLTPDDLLDPKNKRFVGRSIGNFVSPLTKKVQTAVDLMFKVKDTINSFSIAPPDAVETPKATTWQGFPTSHPMVDNGDGTASNVVLSSFWFGDETGGKEIVIPTMVDGKPLTDEEAKAIARKHGLDKYPQFGGTQEEAIEAASKWAEENHGNINEAGQLIEKTEEPELERLPNETSWQWCARTGLCQ